MIGPENLPSGVGMGAITMQAIEREHSAMYSNCGCRVCNTMRLKRIDDASVKELTRLRAIEDAARAILKQIDESVESSLVVGHTETEALRDALDAQRT